MPYTVNVRRAVHAAPGVVWAALVDPAHAGQWFGDFDRIAPGEPFRCDMGDGDYFTGRTVAVERGRELRLQWRFMDIGPSFDIRYTVGTARDGAVLVSVADTGAPIAAEADSLREGWTDFLSRLDGFVTTGARTRFAWSPSIAMGALAAGTVEESRARVTDAWLREHLPGAAATIASRGPAMTIDIAEPRWDGVTTAVTLTFHPLEAQTYLALAHEGWPALPAAMQLSERRRYARTWQTALAALETVTLSR
jgi:uncharacterized protein YndB with AHSA1/START domain